MRVCFSDYNSEVIEQVTIPNVHLNLAEKNWRDAEYYCGDWGSLSPLLSQVRRRSSLLHRAPHRPLPEGTPTLTDWLESSRPRLATARAPDLVPCLTMIPPPPPLR